MLKLFSNLKVCLIEEWSIQRDVDISLVLRYCIPVEITLR